MKTWTPLWSSIVVSSLWGEPKEVRLLFLTMLAMKDYNGEVTATAVGLARMANLTIEETKSAITILESPDAEGNGQEFEGRRIEKVEGGWKVLNHAKYRDEVQKEMRRVRNQKAQQAKRERERLAEQYPRVPQGVTAGEVYELKKARES